MIQIKISEVAKFVKLPISTIRYYEKMGLIPEEYIIREANNYRNYKIEIVQHLHAVKNCLTVGFSINEVKSMVAKNKITKDEQTHFLKQKILEIEEAQKQLNASKQALYDILETGIVCESGFAKHE